MGGTVSGSREAGARRRRRRGDSAREMFARGRVDGPPRRGSSADFPSPIAFESAGSASRNASARSRFALVIARTRHVTTTVTLRGVRESVSM